jgi:hypothetical protein
MLEGAFIKILKVTNKLVLRTPYSVLRVLRVYLCCSSVSVNSISINRHTMMKALNLYQNQTTVILFRRIRYAFFQNDFYLNKDFPRPFCMVAK